MNKIIKYVTTVLACASIATLSAFAAPEEESADPDTVAAAKALMATLKVEEQMGPSLAGVMNMQNSLLEQQNLSEEELKSAKEMMQVSMKEVEKALSWKNLEPIMVNAYTSVFTTAELEGLIELFETPAGQAYIAKQGELQAATMQEMQTIMGDLMPKIQQKVEAAIKRAKKKKANKK
jgi:hypothetical protein